jgi:pyruvate dehydrogenase E1 component alpha subunit
MRDAVLTAKTRPAIEVLDDVYAEPHSSLARQRERFAAYLDGFADEEA